MPVTFPGHLCRESPHKKSVHSTCFFTIGQIERRYSMNQKNNSANSANSSSDPSGLSGSAPLETIRKGPAPSSSGKNSSGSSGKSAWTFRRIAAWAGIILLLALYAATFLAAVFSRPGTGRLFRFCLGMTIAVPVFIWFLTWAAGKLPGRKNSDKDSDTDEIHHRK